MRIKPAVWQIFAVSKSILDVQTGFRSDMAFCESTPRLLNIIAIYGAGAIYFGHLSVPPQLNLATWIAVVTEIS